MKKIFICGCLFLSFMAANAQRNESGIGISVGINNYIPRPEFVSARAGTGFSFGVLGAFKVSKNSDVVTEFGFTSFSMDFMGRPLNDSENRWLDFSNNRLYAAALYYYDLLSYNNGKLKFGVHGGGTATYMNNFMVKGRDNAGYNLAPYDMNALPMRISHYNDNAAFNFFGSLGVNMFYNFMEVNLRYNLGLTSPYEKLQYIDERIDFSGKDDFVSLTFTLYLNKF